MLETSSILKLEPVKPSDYSFLFELLKERKNNENISHKEIPTFKKHLQFVKSKPYSKWYIIFLNNSKIGSIYLTKHNEIGMHFKKSFSKNSFRKICVTLIMKMNPRDRYLINTSPKNTSYIKFLEKNKLKRIQYTYEITDTKELNYEKN